MKKSIPLAFLVLLCACVTNPYSGSRSLILTSEEEENQLGVKAFEEVLSQERLSTNARWTQILSRVGQRIASVSGNSNFSWEFRLIESKEKNAFCLPGGKVAFYTGIFPVAQNEAAIAAIMGHEVAHATARHAGQRMTMAFGTQLAFEGLNALLGAGKSDRRQLLLAALGIGAQVGVVLPFSRANESEADHIGLIYMAQAGYDPVEAVEFWRRFGTKNGASPPKFLSTHPPSEERMEALRAQLNRANKEYARSARYGVGEVL